MLLDSYILTFWIAYRLDFWFWPALFRPPHDCATTGAALTPLRAWLTTPPSRPTPTNTTPCPQARGRCAADGRTLPWRNCGQWLTTAGAGAASKTSAITARRRGSPASSTWPTPVRTMHAHTMPTPRPYHALTATTLTMLTARSPRRRAPRHALGPLQDGHLPGHLRHRMGGLHVSLRPLPADALRTLHRPRPCLVRRPLPAHLPERLGPL